MSKLEKKYYIIQDERLGDSAVFSTMNDLFIAARRTLNDQCLNDQCLNDSAIDKVLSTLDYIEVNEEELEEYDVTYDMREEDLESIIEESEWKEHYVMIDEVSNVAKSSYSESNKEAISFLSEIIHQK